MTVGYGIHSNMTAVHIDKTVCSHAGPYLLSERLLPISPWQQTCGGTGWERRGGQRGCPKARREGVDRSHATLEVKKQKIQEHRTGTGREKTAVGVNLV